jgi:hypothetical protein
MLAAARLWGVAPKTVREWRLKGYLVRASDGRVDVKRSEAKLKQRPHRYRGGTCRGPLAPVQTRAARLLRQMRQLLDLLQPLSRRRHRWHEVPNSYRAAVKVTKPRVRLFSFLFWRTLARRRLNETTAAALAWDFDAQGEKTIPNVSLLAAASQLGISGGQMLSLIKNPACPAPTANPGTGISAISFDQAAITTFAATMAAAKSNGWRVPATAYAAFNWSRAAATAAGPFIGYASHPVESPLFDL